MGKNKPRSHKNSVKFNGFDTQINCPNYEVSSNGNQWCHDQFCKVQGAMTDQNGKLLCKGNRFNCLKQKYDGASCYARWQQSSWGLENV